MNFEGRYLIIFVTIEGGPHFINAFSELPHAVADIISLVLPEMEGMEELEIEDWDTSRFWRRCRICKDLTYRKTQVGVTMTKRLRSCKDWSRGI